MKPLLLYLLLIAQVGMACNGADQFKMFPVGLTSQGDIVSVDFRMYRTDQSTRMKWPALKQADTNKAMWLLYAYISVYSQTQKLLSTHCFDSAYSITDSYDKAMSGLYKNGFSLASRHTVRRFSPSYISFCSFQQKCQRISLKADSVTSSLLYEGASYPLELSKDSTFYSVFNLDGFGIESLEGLYISSFRIYEAENIVLLLPHLGTGHQISMGIITWDPARTTDEEGNQLILYQEHTPDIPFKNIRSCTYQEPILHHGFGMDLFAVKKR